MTEKTATLLKFLQDHQNEHLTSADVAERMGIPKISVDGAFTRGLCPKSLGYRENVQVPGEDGKMKTVKMLRLTEYGKTFNPNEES